MTKKCFTFVILIYTIVIIYECIWNLSPSSVYLLSWTHNWDIRIFGHLTNFSFVSRGNHNIFSFIFLELIRMSSLGQRRRNHFLFCWENKNPDTSMNFTVKSRHLSFLFQFSQIKKETSYFDHYFIFPKTKFQIFQNILKSIDILFWLKKNHSYFNRFQHVCSNFTSNCLLNIPAIWQMLRVLTENTLSA